MTNNPEQPTPDRSWSAENWEELRIVWEGLKQKYEQSSARFRGTELTDQAAGWVFERLIIEAFRLEGLSIHHPYGILNTTEELTRVQHDGIVVVDWQGFLIESRFQKAPCDIDPIFRLHVLVEQRPVGTVGLFFSASDYTRPALESSEFLKPIRVLLFQRVDLEWAFQVQGRMRLMVWRKWARALKLGRPHLPVARYGETSNPPVEIPTGFLGEPFHDVSFDRPVDG